MPSGKKARRKAFASRRFYDARSSLPTTARGVTAFATVDVKDHEVLDFRKVWNPMASQ